MRNSPGSFTETDWQAGSKALFLGPGENGVEDTESAELKAWARCGDAHGGDVHRGEPCELLRRDLAKALAEVKRIAEG